MPRMRQHKDKHVEAALKYAESQGWTVELSRGGSAHPWATVKCPYNTQSCRNGVWCRFGVWGTPSRPEDFARRIMRAVDGCEVHRKRAAVRDAGEGSR